MTKYFSFSTGQKCLLLYISILVGLLHLSYAVAAKVNCDDESKIEHFNCSSKNCTYGEESNVNCTVPESEDCEVNFTLI